MELINANPSGRNAITKQSTSSDFFFSKILRIELTPKGPRHVFYKNAPKVHF